MEKVLIRQKENRLCAGETFPPKPGDSEGGRYQIALGVSATPAGLKVAKAKAQEIDSLLVRERCLGCLVAQLQRIVSDETSSDAQATLQEQLRPLIAALSTWNGRLKTELALQQLINSLERLEGRLDESSKG